MMLTSWSQSGVSCSNYKYGSGISNLIKYFLIYLANQINRIYMTSMDTNSLNCAVFVIYQFKNVNEVWERSPR